MTLESEPRFPQSPSNELIQILNYHLYKASEAIQDLEVLIRIQKKLILLPTKTYESVNYTVISSKEQFIRNNAFYVREYITSFPSCALLDQEITYYYINSNNNYHPSFTTLSNHIVFPII